MKSIVLSFLLFFTLRLIAQEQQFVQFFYADSVVSSEGFLEQGKPNGYWKNYYPNGTLKSVGKRTNFELDSIWNFYSEDGILSKQIMYSKGKKNGYEYSYYVMRDTSILQSKFFYKNDKREKLAYFYSHNGFVHKKIPFVSDTKQGIGYEFSKDSIVTAILEFERDSLLSRQEINRFNSAGEKSGTWVEFYPNGNKKIESNYYKGALQGLYKIYDIHENIERVGQYNNDSLLYSSQFVNNFREPKEQKRFNEDSSYIIFRGQFTQDQIPIGVHWYYSSEQTIDSCVVYDTLGTITGVGIMRTNGDKTGKWKHFFPNGIISAKGTYAYNEKQGEWIFYYETGDVKQQGEYVKDKEMGEWIWFYMNGNRKRVENYVGGKRNGKIIQYDELGNIVVSGNYTDDLQHGYWEIQVGDIIQQGSFVYGEKDGEWIHTFLSNNQIRFKGSFYNTKPQGKHVYYYENGTLEREEFYDAGKPIKRWNYYNKYAQLKYTRYFKDGKEIQILVAD
ncbi:MAG: hypothetical protein PF481_06030 [Bacteroidales bacterium]|jgi:antitoxin component YwqK of YwqJK toxin-antitoxin module|nr:hypothetical protein [Bacteroidales bacterium]